MQARPYFEVDVFGTERYLGNPLAVVADAQGLDTQQMQQFARWTNLSETTFLMAPTHPDADYQVRMFTPSRELPFAGHPTLGSCHAWLLQGNMPRAGTQIVQQCALGLVHLRRDSARLAFCAPPMRRASIDNAALAPVLDALGLAKEAVRKAQWLDNGPRWLGLLVDSAQTVLSLEPNHAVLQSMGLVGVIGPCKNAAAAGPRHLCDFEVRAFAAAAGVPEDPVTGSLNAALGQWLISDGLAPAHYVVSQGARLKRSGQLFIELCEGQLWVGGDCFTCVQGTVQL